MLRRRIKMEKKLLESTKILFDEFENCTGTNLQFYTNYGDVIFEIPNAYPFQPPKIFINVSMNFYDNKKSLTYYFLCKKINDSKLPVEITLKIFNILIDNLPKEQIHFKKFIDNILRYYCDNENAYKIIFDFGDKITSEWSPAKKIINIINYIEDMNKILNISQNKYIKFIYLKNI